MILPINKATLLSGRINLNKPLYFNGANVVNTEYLKQLFSNQISDDSVNSMSVGLAVESSLNAPFYVILQNDKIEIIGKSSSDVTAGITTLKSVMESGDTAQNQVIVDAPKLGHREFLLDVARHYFPISEIKKIIDEMARNRINYLHLHLSDDQGFRMESIKHPELNSDKSYSQSELKDIVKYAMERGIEVIPEIDMPGHMFAVLDKHPELRCDPESTANSMCLGNIDSLMMSFDLIQELCDIFPCKYLHVGCDETDFTSQLKCPKCKEQIKRLGLSNMDDLFVFYINQLNRYIKSMGKKTIVWNDVLKCGHIDDDIVVQKWNDFPFDKRTEDEFLNGRSMIIGCSGKTYFDYPYSLIPLKKTYEYEPSIRGKAVSGPNLLGSFAGVWTETIPGSEKLEHRIFPRLQAYGSGALGNTKDYPSFIKRLLIEEKELIARGIKPAHLWDATHFRISDALTFASEKRKLHPYAKMDPLALAGILFGVGGNALESILNPDKETSRLSLR